MRLKYVLIATFVLLSSIPLVLGFHFLTSYTESQFRLQIEDKLLAISSIAKKRILGVLERIEDTTTQVASRTQLRLSLKAWNSSKAPEHASKIDRIIRDARGNMERMKGITVYNPSSQIVATTYDEIIPGALSLIPEQTRIVRLVHVEGVTQIASVQRLVLDRKTIGFVEVIFSADFLNDLVKDNTGLGSTGEWLFAFHGENGDAVFAVPLKYDRSAAFKRMVPKDRLDVPITQALLGNEISMHFAPDYMEEPVLASTRYIPETDWGLVVKMHESEVNSVVEQAQRYLVWGLASLLLLAVIIGVVISDYIARPFEKLRRDTVRVSKGDFNVHPIERGWAEVVEFSKSFSQMASAVRDLSKNLNQKVAERTEKLDEANKKLQELAIRDSLTGLYNRRYFIERFEYEFERAKRYNTPLTLVIMDIDFFKKINDTWGHAAGDKVLQGVSNFLNKTLRDTDVLGRVGGEEFCMVFLTGKESGVLPVVDRLRLELAGLIHKYEGNDLKVTCSFGVAFLTSRTKSTEELMKQADEALYHAKKEGRNQVMPFSKRRLKTVK